MSYTTWGYHVYGRVRRQSEPKLSLLTRELPVDGVAKRDLHIGQRPEASGRQLSVPPIQAQGRVQVAVRPSEVGREARFGDKG